MSQAYIYDAIRTPRGRAKPSGGLHDLTPLELLDAQYRALEARTGLAPSIVDDVVLGCVTQVGEQGGNIGKASVNHAGWSSKIPAMTINRYCSSGVDAVNIAALKVASGQATVAVAGGVEMMSRVPMMADDATVFSDPELAARCQMVMMGNGADLIASAYGVTREEADTVALGSQQKAAKARDEGWFSSIVPVENTVTGALVGEDECIRPETTMDSLAALQPAFVASGERGIDEFQLADHPELSTVTHVHTAGNSPAMADAASLVLLGTEEVGASLEVAPRAVVKDATTACADPLMAVSGCGDAVRKLLARNGMSIDDIDLFQMHEAFAATVVAYTRELGLDEDKLNVNGGVIALGHPMGATGAIMTGMLLDELERRDLSVGVVAASGAAGTGTALLLDRAI